MQALYGFGLVFALASFVSAQQPPRKIDLRLRPAIPAGDAPVVPVDVGFTLNAETLERYGYTLEGYGKLSPPEQRRVEEWIRALEDARKRALARAGATAPEPSKLGEGWDADKQASYARLKAAAESGGATFDGATGAGGAPAFTPKLELYGLSMRAPDGTTGRGGVRRFSLGVPGGVTLEGGTLGADARNPLVAPSPHYGLSAGDEGTGKRLDWSWKARASMTGLGARLYTDDAPELDANIDSNIDSLRRVDPIWGIKEGEIRSWENSLSYSSAYETTWMFLGSAMGRIGRAYRLSPRVDVGWSAMGVARVAGIFPNLALDQSVAARVKPSSTSNIGVFGGVTETPGLFNKTVVRDSFAGDKFKIRKDVQVDAAPHATIAAWGKVPYLANVDYQVSAGQQWNPWTTVRTLSGGATADVKGVKVGGFAKYDAERGDAVEFARNKTSAGVVVTPTQGVDLTGQYFRDTARLGTAEMNSQGFMLGLTVTETNGASKGASVTMASLFGGGQNFISDDKQSQWVQDLQSFLDLARVLKDVTLTPNGGPEQSWKKLQEAWAGLSPGVKKVLEDAWGEVNPGAPALSRILAIKPGDLGTLDNFVNLVTDTRVLERLLVRYMRSEILKEMEEVNIPVLGKKVRFTAPMVIAAAHAYGLSVAGVPAITERDARESIDGFLLRKLGGKLGCEKGEGDATKNATDCVLSKIPEGARKEIEEQFGDDLPNILKGAVGWPSDVIRREINRLLLQVILAAETLNELAVDGGERIGDHNVRALMSSFSYLDKRGRSQVKSVLKSAAEGLREELAAQDAKMRAELVEYGSARLDWLQVQPAWPSNVRVAVRSQDWADLLAVYGDAKLFDFILRAKGKLAAAFGDKPARLMISFDKNATFGTTTVMGDPMEVKLGPKPVELKFLELPLPAK